MADHSKKLKIPNPKDVPAKHEAAVLAHVAGQFGLSKTHEGHYGIKPGSVTVGATTKNASTGMNETPVTLIRTDDPAVTAEDHGLDLSE